MVTALCAVLVFQSTVVVSLWGYAIYIQPGGTAAVATTITLFPVYAISYIIYGIRMHALMILLDFLSALF
jgi:hypothetical protein